MITLKKIFPKMITPKNDHSEKDLSVKSDHSEKDLFINIKLFLKYII